MPLFKQLGRFIICGRTQFAPTINLDYSGKYNDVAFLMKAFNHSKPETTLLYIGASKVEIIDKTRNLDFGIIQAKECVTNDYQIK